MKQFMVGVLCPGEDDRVACVRAENPNQAMRAARLLGIKPGDKVRCDKVDHIWPAIPETFVGRVLGQAEIADIRRISCVRLGVRIHRKIPYNPRGVQPVRQISALAALPHPGRSG